MKSDSHTLTQRVKFHLSNDYWKGLERLEIIKKIIASDISDGEKQDKIAQLIADSLEVVIDA